MLQTGEWPKVIDHKNGDRSDNRWGNLRDTDYTVNAENRSQARKTNSTGLLGVSRRGKKFHASIKALGKNWHIGNYETAQEAHEAYLEVKRVAHQGYAG